MIQDVDESLLTLLRAEGSALLKRINISFRAPDKDFPNKVTPPGDRSLPVRCPRESGSAQQRVQYGTHR